MDGLSASWKSDRQPVSRGANTIVAQEVPPLRVFSTLALRGVFDALSASDEKQHLPSDIRFAPTAVLLEQFKAGTAGDLAILTSEAIQRLEADGTLVKGTRRDLVQSPIGLAVRAGSPHPRIGTLSDFIATLRSAKSLVYSRAGASGIFFATALERLGLVAELAHKSIVIPSGFTAETVARGEADIAIQQISELKVVPGIEVVGALPDGAQLVSTFSCGIFSSSDRRKRAEALSTYLGDPALATVYEAAGLLQVSIP